MNKLSNRLDRLENATGDKAMVICGYPRNLSNSDRKEDACRRMAGIYYERTDFDMMMVPTEAGNGPSFAFIPDFDAFLDAVSEKSRGNRIGVNYEPGQPDKAWIRAILNGAEADGARNDE